MPTPESTFSNRVLWLGLAACILIAGTFASCARPSDEPSSARASSDKERRLPAKVIPDSEIQRFAPQAAERQLLTWGQALQFNDPVAVIEFMSPAAIRAVGTRADLVSAVQKASVTMPRLTVINVRPTGRTAVIRTAETTYDDRNDRRKTLTLTSYRMVKVGKRWKVDDPTLLVDALKASTADSRE